MSFLLGSALCISTVHAASLGELRLLSALGEKFEATVSVTVADDEYLDSACFSLGNPRADDGVRMIKRARFELKAQGTHTVLHLRGLDSEYEPIVRLLVRYACPQSMLVFEREYSVLLDPRDHVSPVSSQVPPALVVIQRVLPAAVPAPPKPQLASTVAASRKPHPERSVRPSAVPDQGLRLQIALAPPDLTQAVPMDEKTALAMRERLLLLEADDQAAQLLELKDRIAKLEKQLDHVASLADVASVKLAASPVPAQAASAPATSPNLWSWSWSWLLLLLPLPLPWWYWRKRTQKREQQAYDQIFGPTIMPQPEAAIAPIAAQSAADTPNAEWQSVDMAVVSPGNVNEEVQLLLDHGMTTQAMDLLRDEIRLRPSALAMWMRLFETCVLRGDRATFAEFAKGFKAQFMSEALWLEVQTLGAKLDPDEPLYQTGEILTLEATDHVPKGNDDFDLADYLIPAQAKPVEKDAAQSLDLPKLDFFVEAPSELAGGAAFSPEDFHSDDAQLSEIALLLRNGQFDEAYQRLEQLLYTGTLTQRITASSWLDRLLPVRDSRN